MVYRISKVLKLSFVFLFTVTITFFLVNSANAKTVTTDPATGYEQWWLSSSGVPYYTTTPFSPNGKYLIYGGCMIINADGTNERKLPGTCTSGVGEGGVMGWWSHDSRNYYHPDGLYVNDIINNTQSRIPNYSQYLPFYFAELSPDGRILSGISNSNDISSGTSQVKFVNIDGSTNSYKVYTSPGRQTGGFDVTHGWLGNDAAWYLNNSQWEQYTDVPMVFNVNTGEFLGPLNVGSKTWDGLFTHPTLSPSAYMIGIDGKIAGNGTKLRYANANYKSTNATERQLTVIGSVTGNHTNFSPDGKRVVVGATSGSNAGFITVYELPSPLSTSGVTPIKVARFKASEVSEGNSAYATFSPDGTKIVYKGFDSPSGVYMAIFNKPLAPTNLKASTTSGGASITWKTAPQHREIKEYEIYKSNTQNGTYTKIATVPEVYTYLDTASKITASLSGDNASINVDSTTDFPTKGVIEVLGLSTEKPSELISYNSKTTNSFTGLARGYGGTSSAEHWNDSFVWLSREYTGYTDTSYQSGTWYKIKSVEWSGLTSDFSGAVSVSGSTPSDPTDPTIPSPTTPPTPPPTNCSVVADINCDNKVDSADYKYVASKFSTADSTTDIDKSGKVNAIDLSIVISKYGTY